MTKQATDQFRVIFNYDNDQVATGCDGNPLPEPRAVYEANVMTPGGGKALSYEEYCQYYGNPDRHTILWCRLEKRCPCCGMFGNAGSIGGNDLMDDDPALNQINLGASLTLDEAKTLPGYVAEVVQKLYAEAVTEE